MEIVPISCKADNALAASEAFYRDDLARVRSRLEAGHQVMMVFTSCDHSHRGWRRAITGELAREYAPLRINAIAIDGGPGDGGPDDGGSDDGATDGQKPNHAIAAFHDYLQNAPGITGQYFECAGDLGANPIG